MHCANTALTYADFLHDALGKDVLFLMDTTPTELTVNEPDRNNRAKFFGLAPRSH